ncbi:MAG: ribosome biogenesis GTP-binding protein YihA/YsxC [Hyphomicrobiales bacterium]|nr:ribosome biogenesis GTP-binding protein YihA/YsxC [Hyphomicrobiales bacterium]
MAAAERLLAKPWEFVRGIPSLEFLTPADRPEIAFAGRSNVGKSSLINAVANRRNLARTSNTPGRTQELNFFTVGAGDFYFVDMPGYGFAKAPKAKVEAWTDLIKAYLRGRPTLRRVFVLVDARHGLKDVDHQILSLLDEAAVAYQIVLTKIDKLKQGALERVKSDVEQAIAQHPAAFPVVLATSSEKRLGLAELKASIVDAIA